MMRFHSATNAPVVAAISHLHFTPWISWALTSSSRYRLLCYFFSVTVGYFCALISGGIESPSITSHILSPISSVLLLQWPEFHSLYSRHNGSHHNHNILYALSEKPVNCSCLSKCNFGVWWSNYCVHWKPDIWTPKYKAIILTVTVMIHQYWDNWMNWE